MRVGVIEHETGVRAAPGIASEMRNTELELKKAKRMDYDKILGVEKDAGDAVIKKACRKLGDCASFGEDPGE